MAAQFVLREKPELNSPRLIAGFGGWLDGGEASTGTVRYLVRRLEARRIGELPAAESQAFYTFQLPGIESARPHIKLQDGIVAELRAPRNDLYCWTQEGGPDLLFLLGAEPHLRWADYVEGVVELARQLGVVRLYSTGGVLGGVPHTKEASVSAIVSHPSLKDELASYAVRYSNYEGPATFQSYLVHAFGQAGLEAIHFTARALYYPEFNIAFPRDPKAILGILRRFKGLLGISLDLSDVVRAEEEVVAQIEEAANQNPGLRRYVQQLEESFVEMKYQEPLLGQPEDFVQSAEEFLRQMRQGADD